MAEFYCYEGIRNNGTFKLNETTKTAIKDDPKSIVGKVVTITGNYEVGYGAAGERPLGFVVQVEKETTNSENMVVSVEWNVCREETPCAGTETAGAFLVCDGTGGFKASTDPSNAVAYGVDATAKSCTAYISG